MSRFYSALKEASRRQARAVDVVAPEGTGPALEAVLSAAAPVGRGESAAAAFARQEFGQPGLVEPATAEAAAVAEPVADVEPGVLIESENYVVQHTDVKLDRKAPLIPHAVDASVLEHYRKLRTKIMQQHAEKPFRSLVVTSANPREGKSVTALNLGLSFSMLPNFRVLVVDGDVRRGSLGKWLGVEERPGLTNLLDGTAKLEDVVLKSDESPMCFVVRGTSTMAPGELLQSPNMSGHFKRLCEHFDLILVDSPPVSLLTDTQLIAASCDAVLLVARAFSTTRKSFEKTVNDLSPFRVVGTILNGGISAPRRYGYGYRGYY